MLWHCGASGSTSNRSAAVKDQISGCITYLAAGDADQLVVPNEGDLGPHFESALKIPQGVKEVLNEGKSKFMAVSVRPSSVLRAAERASAV